MIDELGVARAISDGTLPSPQHFGASWYWAIRISGVGCAWRESVNEFCWREPTIWLTPAMCMRATGLPVLIDHPESGVLNSSEFARRCVGVTVCGYINGDELWAIARILDSGANAILAAGAYLDTSPAVTFAPGTGARIDVGGAALLLEPPPMLLDHICLTAKGVWTRDGPPGVDSSNIETTENEKVAA
jgi:colicin import membrane protein